MPLTNLAQAEIFGRCLAESTPATCSTECLRRIKGAGTARELPRLRLAVTASVPYRTMSSATCCRSFQRRRPCARACLPVVGATWETATTLHIVRRDMHNRESVQAAREFVDHLLLLRVGSPIDTCELSLSKIQDDYMLVSRINIWIRHILKCKVRVLSLNIDNLDEMFELNVRTLRSGHLKRLELSNVAFENSLLDFSCCPALEILDMNRCGFWMVDRISSQSLKYLNINRYCVFGEDTRTHIYTPNFIHYGLKLVTRGLLSSVECHIWWRHLLVFVGITWTRVINPPISLGIVVICIAVLVICQKVIPRITCFSKVYQKLGI